MYTVTIKPELEGALRSVLIEDADHNIVAVMNTRLPGGTTKAQELALAFIEAATNKAKLDEALETIRALRVQNATPQGCV